MKRTLRILCTLFLLLSLLSGCGKGVDSKEYSFFAMDTLITVRLCTEKTDGSSLREEELESLFSRAETIVTDLEKTLSRTRPDSDTYALNKSENGCIFASSVLTALLSESLRIAEETDGAFSPALGLLTDLWNINKGGPRPSDADIRSALIQSDHRTLTVSGNSVAKHSPDVQIDLGGIAKGYAVEQLCAALSESDCAWGLVSIGGNVGVFGAKSDGTPFKIGITDPENTSSTAGYWLIEAGTIAVSGDYERFFEEDGVRYHHILDPSTGMPADSGIRSTAVFSQDGALADALSTALFVMGTEKAFTYYNEHPGTFEAVLITDNNEIYLTPGLRAGEDFLTDGKTVHQTQFGGTIG